jgi:hypothetical protein
MLTWLLIWLVLWFGVMGLPIYVFKKHGVTLYQKSYQHTVLYVAAILVLFAVYGHFYRLYFHNLSFYQTLIILTLCILWLWAPRAYKQDYYTKAERLRYQIPKFFDILFQQLCFLGGLLTFNISPLALGVLFFLVHLPGVFFLPKKFALFVSIGSLAGGLLFAYLQSQGVIGFLTALTIHLCFWIAFHYTITSTKLLKVAPFKR